MKKITTILLVLSCFSALAQNSLREVVNPYFPAPQSHYQRTDGRTQITYYEMNFVTTRLQKFLKNSMKMSMDNDQTSFDEKGNELFFTVVFKEMVVSNREPYQLKFQFSVFEIDKDLAFRNNLLIKSVKITGDKIALVNFYVNYWNSEMNFDAVMVSQIISNQYMQDLAKINTKGTFFIEVLNNFYHNDTELFIKQFSEKRIAYNEAEKQKSIEKLHKEEEEKKESLKKELDKQKRKDLFMNTSYKRYVYLVSVTKKGTVRIRNGRDYSDNYALEMSTKEKINEFILKNLDEYKSKKGDYSKVQVGCEYVLIYKKLDSVKFKILSPMQPW